MKAARALTLLLAVVFIVSLDSPRRSPFDIRAASRLPVLEGGRVKPLGSVARNSLLVLRGKQSVRANGSAIGAVEWLLDAMARPETADGYEVFVIDDPDILGLFGREPGAKRYFSYRELEAFEPAVHERAVSAAALESAERSRFEAALVNLDERLTLYGRIKSGMLFAPESADFGRLLAAYRVQDAEAFNAVARSLPVAPAAAREELYNRAEPFYKGMVLYLAAALLILASWVAAPERLRRLARDLLLLALAVHSAGLVFRIVLQGRPPVTNLYSSAVFVGWGAVVFGALLERRFQDGFAALAASAIGFGTLIIAHHLAAQGETMEMMRAVLDSNFWLATHVVTITIGYSSMFLASALAHVYILRRWFGAAPDPRAEKNLASMTYGIICLSLFFSFVGTVLGGIWADQSWGRFWGWDPKENGALLIVLWNAFALHARWGGYARERGVMAMAVFGGILTSLSWFGVNMLGVGLHSYGFMAAAFDWLLSFILVELGVIGAAYFQIAPRRELKEAA